MFGHPQLIKCGEGLGPRIGLGRRHLRRTTGDAVVSCMHAATIAAAQMALRCHPRRFSLNSAPCWCWRVLLAPAILEMDSTEPRSQKNTANRDGASSRISARLATFCLTDPPDSHIQPLQGAFRLYTWAHRSRVPLRCMRQICVATDAAAA
jgi:hypothetical protein